MKTVSLGIENLCVPCYALCRYCLLSSCRTATGVDYERGKRLAKRVWLELKEKRPDVNVFHYIGYCMDTPHLADYIRFSREIGSPSADFLQFNGLCLRNEEETEALVRMVKELGVENIDLTIYGLREYHDRFAGRSGDFDFLLRILDAANRVELPVTVSIPLTRENMDQVDGGFDLLEDRRVRTYSVFFPHSKGRGALLAGQRLTKAEFDGLSDRIHSRFYKIQHMTEREWLKGRALPEATRRTVNLCLTPENIDFFEKLTGEEILHFLEKLDDEYYSRIPTVHDLARMYGDPRGEGLYRFRDLHLKWQQMYLAECGQDVHDMNDERHHFSVRI